MVSEADVSDHELLFFFKSHALCYYGPRPIFFERLLVSLCSGNMFLI